MKHVSIETWLSMLNRSDALGPERESSWGQRGHGQHSIPAPGPAPSTSPCGLGEPFKLEKKPTTQKVTWKRGEFALIKWDAWTLPGEMAGLLLLMPVLTFSVPKQHCYSFIPRKDYSGRERTPTGCPLRADAEPHSTTLCFKQGSCPCGDHTTAGSASPSTISIAWLDGMVHSLGKRSWLIPSAA